MGEKHVVTAGKPFAVEKLDVFGVAIEFLQLLDPIAPRLWRRNSALWDQLKRASASVLANIGEASSTLRPAERRHFFEYAYRSAGECASMILAYEALGALPPDVLENARTLLHRIQMMLLRLIRKDTRQLSAPHRFGRNPGPPRPAARQTPTPPTAAP